MRQLSAAFAFWDNGGMNLPVVIAGGGIGGLAAALACARVGLPVQVVEQADAFGEVGAGIQLGPNAMRVLADLGVTPALDADLAWPLGLHVRDVMDGRQLAHLHLGEAMVKRYGAPYATVARADLHRALLASLRQHAKDAPDEAVGLQTGTQLLSWEQQDGAVLAHVQGQLGNHTSRATSTSFEARVLVGADGARSQVRTQFAGLPTLAYSGHVAYRAVIDQQRLPVHLRQRDVSVWLGPGLHVVHYPIAGGQRLNIVALLEGPLPQGPVGWDHPAPMPALLVQW
jgi:salicylate hydroxylase